jgi:hypothetical protein
VVFEARKDADGDPREETEVMARWWCQRLPRMEMRSDRRLVAGRA